MKAVNVNDVLKILHEYGAFVFVTDSKRYSEMVNKIANLPELRPKTGHWIRYASPRCGEQHYKCTNCDDYVNFGQYGDYYTKDFKFCPHCGAKMEGAGE